MLAMGGQMGTVREVLCTLVKLSTRCDVLYPCPAALGVPLRGTSDFNSADTQNLEAAELF